MNGSWRFICAVFFIGFSLSARSESWMEWRGPLGNGHAAAGENPPITWSDSQNVKWKVAVPGRGHSSPTVVGDLVILTSADDEREAQFVVAFDKKTGEQKWLTPILDGNLPDQIHKKNTHASSTAVTDGKQIFTVFFNGVSVYATALSMSGEKLWHRKVGEFHSRYPFGFGSSPELYGDTVIVTAEYENDGYILALRKSDGAEVWRIDRGDGTSYSTPVVANVAGKDQLLISGQKKVSSFDPATGKLNWEVAGSSPATCGTMVWSEDAVFASGGYPNKETIAVRADGSGTVLWRNGEKCYEQSMLYFDGHIYAMNDGGIAFCWDAETGEEKWKERLRGPVSASPVLVNGNIFATNEQGITFVFKASPKGYEEVARNQLGESGFATPTFVGDQIFVRTAYNGAKREEWLFCIGK